MRRIVTFLIVALVLPISNVSGDEIPFDFLDGESLEKVFFDFPVSFYGVFVSPFINSTKCFFQSLSICNSNF